jgi:hypothetical protein
MGYDGASFGSGDLTTQKGPARCSGHGGGIGQVWRPLSGYEFRRSRASVGNSYCRPGDPPDVGSLSSF